VQTAWSKLSFVALARASHSQQAGSESKSKRGAPCHGEKPQWVGIGVIRTPTPIAAMITKARNFSSEGNMPPRATPSEAQSWCFPQKSDSDRHGSLQSGALHWE
jgi:hypothetical protein